MKKKLKFLIVASNFYPKITGAMVKETSTYLSSLKYNYELFRVNGSLEIPVLISILI